MAAGSSTKRDTIGSSQTERLPLFADVGIDIGAAVVFAVIFAPLLNYGTAITGNEVGFVGIVVASAILGALVSLSVHMRKSE